MNASIQFKQAIEYIDSLPAMPVIAQKILFLNLGTPEGEDKLLKLIELDPAISAKIIGLSKSTLYGSPGMIASVKEATMRLGLQTVKSVAIGLATIEALHKTTGSQLGKTELWTRSIAVAMAMKVLAKHMPPRQRPLDDQIFLAGLLHDIGYIVIDYISPMTCDSLLSHFDAENDAELLALEKQVLSMSHGEIGGKLSAYWDLPEEIGAVVRFHHNKGHSGAEVGQPLVRLVYLAERILTPFGIKEGAPQIEQMDWLELGINPGKAEEIVNEVQQAASNVNQFFHI